MQFHCSGPDHRNTLTVWRRDVVSAMKAVTVVALSQLHHTRLPLMIIRALLTRRLSALRLLVPAVSKGCFKPWTKTSYGNQRRDVARRTSQLL